MPQQVETWDYDNRRIFLSFETVTNGVDLAAAYLEERAYRATSGADVRGRRPMLRGQGRLSKGGGRFTPQFVLFLNGARPVPYDTSHVLRLLTEPISDDGSLSGASIFDRLPLSPSSSVDVDIAYRQVEIITVPTGGALTSEQATQLSTTATQTTDLHATLESAGVFSKGALANSGSQPVGSTPQRFDINLIARAEDGVESPQVIQYREVVFCPDALDGDGLIYIGKRDGSAQPLIT